MAVSSAMRIRVAAPPPFGPSRAASPDRLHHVVAPRQGHHRRRRRRCHADGCRSRRLRGLRGFGAARQSRSRFRRRGGFPRSSVDYNKGGASINCQHSGIALQKTILASIPAHHFDRNISVLLRFTFINHPQASFHQYNRLHRRGPLLTIFRRSACGSIIVRFACKIFAMIFI